MVLVLTVHPGFGGQEFLHDAAKKISRIRKIVGPGIRVEVDGGIDPDTTAQTLSSRAMLSFQSPTA
jgi:ribulose-phosphate 3-epimerase